MQTIELPGGGDRRALRVTVGPCNDFPGSLYIGIDGFVAYFGFSPTPTQARAIAAALIAEADAAEVGK